MGFLDISILDIIDILIVAIIIFKIYRVTRGTNAISIIVGILIVYLIWVIVRLMHMELLSMLLGQIIGVGVIALIVVFQQEIRRFLLLLGSRYFSGQSRFFGKYRGNSINDELYIELIDAVVTACGHMAESKTGALIVFAERIDMTSITDNGVEINATVSSQLLENLFFKNSPLHDGAVVISAGRIKAAGCILPSTESELQEGLGTRHRAALGATEEYDVTVIAVSEERGSITVAQSRELHLDLTLDELRERLLQLKD